MTLQDTTSLRPRYLNRVHEMDYHMSVWDSNNERVMLFVTDKGSNKGYFTTSYDPTKQKIWYWTKYEHCTYALNQLSKDPCTIQGDAIKSGLKPGTYKCSVTRVNNQRLVSYEFTI